jgi:curved DNA-binding protein CbpA
MDYSKASKILELDESLLNLKYLKKKYHELALKNHPDKNGNTSQSKEKFQELNEAYEFLSKELEEEEDNNSFPSSFAMPSYVDILQTFLQNIMDEKHSQLFCEIIKDIVMKKLSFTLFEELDKETATKVYTFLMKYRIILNISPEVLERLKEMVSANEKEHVSKVFHLKPTLSDLFSNNIYKLYVEDRLYLVPLWHSELYFDGENNTEIVVLCEPDLEENITIDEYNNVHTSIEIAFSTIIDLINSNDPLTFVLCNNTMSIPIDKLFMKKEQLYKIKKGGLSKIKGNNIYDVDDKADVIVRIKFVS